MYMSQMMGGNAEVSIVQGWIKCAALAKPLGYSVEIKTYGPPVPKFQHADVDAPELAGLQNHPALQHSTFVIKDDKGVEIVEAGSLVEIGAILTGIKTGMDLFKKRDEFIQKHGGK